MIYVLDDFFPFIEFILKKHIVIVGEPIRGEIWKLCLVFVEFCNQFNFQLPTQDFRGYIMQFNEISDDSIKLNKKIEDLSTVEFLKERIEWIGIDAVRILKSKITCYESHIGRKKKNLVTTHPKISRTLKDFIDNKSFTRVNLKCATRLNLELMLEFIDKPSAKTILGKARAREITPINDFPKVCNDHKHALVLSNIAFGRKDIQSINTNSTTTNKKSNNCNPSSMLSTGFIHRKIYQSRNLLGSETYECSLSKVHFLPMVYPHTDLALGDCSYLDTCHKIKTCRYLHYFTLNAIGKTVPKMTPTAANKVQPTTPKTISNSSSTPNITTPKTTFPIAEYSLGECFTETFREITPPQWISCDVRLLPFRVLGKFAAIISDPAWDIHMSLPYSTCKDDELLNLPMCELQDEGIIMLWVTGRSIEIGRRALTKWGYTVSNEMIWIKLNQLKRTIVTGRTGHWLNHSKEHLLVGLKGNPSWLNYKIDTDVVASNTRETSRKPDELYEIIERMVGKHARKLEIFGRMHNTRPGWLTIGSQLQGVSLSEPEVIQRYNMYMKSST